MALAELSTDESEATYLGRVRTPQSKGGSADLFGVTDSSDKVDSLIGVLTRPLNHDEPTELRRDEPSQLSSTDNERHTELSLERLTPGSIKGRVVSILQQWEGVVEEVESGEVHARLFDINKATADVDVVSLPIEEFATEERGLLSSGEIFYWTIAYEVAGGGGRRRVSELRLKRTPRLTQSGLDRIERNTHNIAKLFGLEDA